VEQLSMPPKRFQKANHKEPCADIPSNISSSIDDEYDYMSGEFVVVDQTKSKNNNANPQTTHKKVKLNEIMKTTRDEGLKTSIGEDNVGFQMLSKMGFKKGQGLGKNSLGIVEPSLSILQVIEVGLAGLLIF
jgi:hypothetical protein